MRIKLINDLLIIYICSIVLVLIISYIDIQALRVILGIPFILFFPGYTFIAALFPKKGDLTYIERVAISFGLSIAVVPLIGLVLNYVWEIQLTPILFSLIAFIGLMSIIAWYRRRGLADEDQFNPDLKLFPLRVTSLFRQNNSSKLDKAVSTTLMIAVLGIIVTFGYIITSPKVGENFTEFYILGPEGEAAGYPREIVMNDNNEVSLVRYVRVVEDETQPWQSKSSETLEVIDDKARTIVGIENREREIVRYEVEVTFGGVLYERIGVVELNHGDLWETEVGLIPEERGEDQKVEFKLYKIREFGAEDEKHTLLSLWLAADELSSKVVNQGQSEVAYKIEVKMKKDEGEETKNETIGPIVVVPGDEWEQVLDSTHMSGYRIEEFSLYRDNSLLAIGDYINKNPVFDGDLLYEEETSKVDQALHLWIDVK